MGPPYTQNFSAPDPQRGDNEILRVIFSFPSFPPQNSLVKPLKTVTHYFRLYVPTDPENLVKFVGQFFAGLFLLLARYVPNVAKEEYMRSV